MIMVVNMKVKRRWRQQQVLSTAVASDGPPHAGVEREQWYQEEAIFLTGILSSSKQSIYLRTPSLPSKSVTDPTDSHGTENLQLHSSAAMLFYRSHTSERSRKETVKRKGCQLNI